MRIKWRLEEASSNCCSVTPRLINYKWITGLRGLVLDMKVGGPACGWGVGAWWSLRSHPTQAVLWLYVFRKVWWLRSLSKNNWDLTTRSITLSEEPYSRCVFFAMQLAATLPQFQASLPYINEVPSAGKTCSVRRCREFLKQLFDSCLTKISPNLSPVFRAPVFWVMWYSRIPINPSFVMGACCLACRNLNFQIINACTGARDKGKILLLC